MQTASVANPLPQMHAYKTQLVPVGMTRVDETVQTFTIMSWAFSAFFMESLVSYAPVNLSCLKICQARLSDGAAMESHASDSMVILLVPKSGKTRLRLVPVIFSQRLCVTPDVPSGGDGPWK